MEDDIDIEEHDVLDQLRVRESLLARVKDEPVEREEGEDGDGEYQTEQMDYFSTEVKQEVSDFEEEEYITPDYNEESFFIPNKIILGSKPNQKQLKKEEMDAVVLVEDYSQKLINNPSFCVSCDRLFSTPNALDAHKMIAHSFLIAVTVNKAKKSTTKNSLLTSDVNTNSSVSEVLSYSEEANEVSENSEKKPSNFKTEQPSVETKFCDHCNKYFANQTELIKHLYQLLPANVFKCTICPETFKSQANLLKHTSQHVKDENSDNYSIKTTYKCLLCHHSGMTKHMASLHRKAFHPAYSKKKLFQPIKSRIKEETLPITSVKIEKVTKIDTADKKKTRNKGPPFTPKCIFYCKNCKLSTTSVFGAICHRCTDESCYKCNICDKKFHVKDKPAHSKQHKKLANIPCYAIVKDLTDKIICLCPKCDVNISLKYFKNHFKQCGSLPTITCNKCSLTVHKSKFREHIRWHGKTKYLRVEYITDKTDKNIEIVQKKEERTKEDQKKGKANFKIFYCDICKACMGVVKSVHKLRTCSTTDHNDICTDCGLSFTKKSIIRHKERHKQVKFTVADLKIFQVDTLKRIPPPIPIYPKCTKCNINFFTRLERKCHICGEDFITCNICYQKFQTTLYPVHKLLHDVKETQHTNTVTMRGRRITKRDEMMPELLKKYESLKFLWNIVFKCSQCAIISDSYNTIVEHSQGHRSDPKFTTDYLKCLVCNLKIDETYWSKHTDLHYTMPSLKANKFNILDYEPNNLLTEEWYSMFEELPEEQIRQIVDPSVYCHERCVKMRLMKDGRSEFSIYTCNKCFASVSPDDIKNHLTQPCSRSRKECSICDITFDSDANLAQHSVYHDNGVDRMEFRIISFNKVQRKGTLYKAYICSKCKMTVLKPSSKKIHSCVRGAVAKCNICRFTFPVPSMWRHKLMHENHRDFTPNNIAIEIFDPQPRPQYSRSYINPVASKTINPVLYETRRRPVQPKTVVSTKVKKYVNDTKRVFMMYKCGTCKIGLTLKKSVPRHTCNFNKEKIYCKLCKLLFFKKDIVKHRRKHRDDKHFIFKNIVVNTFTPGEDVDAPEPSATVDNDKFDKGTIKKVTSLARTKTPDNVDRKTRKIEEVYLVNEDVEESDSEGSTDNTQEASKKKFCTLYKCDCGVHHLSMTSLDKHMKVCGKDSASTEHCSKCGLLFTTNVLVSHLCKHHTQDTEIIVEEVRRRGTQKQEMEIDRSNTPEKSPKSKPDPLSKNNSINTANATDQKTEQDNTQSEDSEKPSTSRKRGRPRKVNQTPKVPEAIKAPKEPKLTEIKLYKCKECNVYYVNQNTCYKHTLNHVKLDEKQYIECKICGFQFTLYTLALHMKKHHSTNTFNIENVVVEEYSPETTAVDVYKAIDRLQNPLVSSSNDSIINDHRQS